MYLLGVLGKWPVPVHLSNLNAWHVFCNRIKVTMLDFRHPYVKSFTWFMFAFYFNSNDKHIAWSSKTIHITYTIVDFCHIDFYVGRKVQHKMLYKHTSPGPGLTFLQWSLRSILQTFSNSGSIWIVSSRAKNSTRSCFLHLGEILWASASSNVSFLTMSARQ